MRNFPKITIGGNNCQYHLRTKRPNQLILQVYSAFRTMDSLKPKDCSLDAGCSLYWFIYPQIIESKVEKPECRERGQEQKTVKSERWVKAVAEVRTPKSEGSRIPRVSASIQETVCSASSQNMWPHAAPVGGTT